MDDFMGDYAGDERRSLHMPRYPEARQHDDEASGSGAQHADAYASAIFGTPPPPPTYPSTWEPWEVPTMPPIPPLVEDPWAEADTAAQEEEVHVRRVQPHRDRHPPRRLDLSGRRPRPRR